jgi:acyl-CoA oxidase
MDLENNIENCLIYRLHFYLEKCLKKLGNEKPSFNSFNNAQTFYLQSLNKSFADFYIYTCFMNKLYNIKESSTKDLLRRLFKLFYLRVINDDGVCFRNNDFMSSEIIYEVREEILKLCEVLKNDLINILDVIAPPDHILNSPMGHSDGQIYERYLNEILSLRENQNLII